MPNPSELERAACPVCFEPRQWQECSSCAGDGLDGEAGDLNLCRNCLGSGGWWECERCLKGVEGE